MGTPVGVVVLAEGGVVVGAVPGAEGEEGVWSDPMGGVAVVAPPTTISSMHPAYEMNNLSLLLKCLFH